jgi:2-C-methyl-D-erythritol 4-phosphate cytidylyltransferase
MLSAIIVAAGSSRRIGFDKIAAPIAGRTVIGHALSAFQNCAAVAEMIVVARVDRIHDLQSLLEGRFTKLREIVAGGAHRQDSVCAGLAAVSAEADFIGVHDAARPLVTPELIERVFAEAQPHGAAAAAGPVTDTLKRATAEHVVCGGVDRENLYAMQTPQIFSRSLLVQAYERVEADRVRVTDEVSAVEHIGAKVVLVPNNEQNFKITFPEDLRLAELVLAARLRH